MATALKRKVWEQLTRSQGGESISGWPTCFSETYWPDRTQRGVAWWTWSDTIDVPRETVSLQQHTPRTQTQWHGGRCSRTKLLFCSEICPTWWHKKPRLRISEHRGSKGSGQQQDPSSLAVCNIHHCSENHAVFIFIVLWQTSLKTDDNSLSIIL